MSEPVKADGEAFVQEGGCRCGAVRLKISARPLLTMACHCTGCQTMSASAFSLSAAIPSAAFEVTKGEPVIAGLHGASRHYFCGHCMTWMFTRPEGMDFFVNLRPTMLDDPSWFVPYMETWTSEKLPWATTPAVRSFEALPPEDAYGDMIAGYAATWAGEIPPA
ncbi:MAG: GFA family protein [Candidatus Kaistia colombiensis]|nr:MAG: GFA family protein [Kaistia sp.]